MPGKLGLSFLLIFLLSTDLGTARSPRRDIAITRNDACMQLCGRPYQVPKPVPQIEGDGRICDRKGGACMTWKACGQGDSRQLDCDLHAGEVCCFDPH